ncbi:helix-turn-helix transcriptional regulator [Megasphaera sp. CLA-AA-H81]|jgi:transcriptional regulator with XRE-family HTH domain|uniref:Helix-turn-helix transcriptional regulator n=1 Tax=Megasphaera intestinihominis TaxID=3133159 RepID=A0ABV1CXU2_9FIRM
MKLLKKLREEKGLTQSELGKKLGISPSTVGMYEQGRRVPDVPILKKMSAFFNVSIDYLLENVNHNVPTKMPKDLNKFLQQSEIIFDGDTYNLTDEDRDLVMKSLEVAFLAAKRANKRKKGDTPTK